MLCNVYTGANLGGAYVLDVVYYIIGSALYVIQIFGQPMSKLFPILDTLSVGKNSGRTNLIERFNCTLRQRVSRLVRDTLSNSCEVIGILLDF